MIQGLAKNEEKQRVELEKVSGARSKEGRFLTNFMCHFSMSECTGRLVTASCCLAETVPWRAARPPRPILRMMMSLSRLVVVASKTRAVPARPCRTRQATHRRLTAPRTRCQSPANSKRSSKKNSSASTKFNKLGSAQSPRSLSTAAGCVQRGKVSVPLPPAPVAMDSPAISGPPAWAWLIRRKRDPSTPISTNR